jgi:hypothetical protein
MLQIFIWLESTGLARAVGESLYMTAWLSAIHLIGFSLVMSGGFIWNLRATGLLLSVAPPESIARSARRLLVTGLTISLPTGLALFAPRASDIAPSSVFQLKMGLLVLAATFQLILTAVVLSRPTPSAASLRASGALGLMLWLSLAVTACWFILFE